jgi:hypothetical protein
MRSKTFAILIVIFCVLGLAAYFSFKQGRDQRQTQMGERLFDDLAVNSVAAVRLIGPDGEVRLKKGANTWEVENQYGYKADFDKIADLVKKLMHLKVGRSFAADDGVRERLALFAPQKNGQKPAAQQAIRVVLSDGEERVMADVLVGKARESSGSGNGGHHLMRLAPDPDDSVYLVDKSFRYLKTDPADWLFKELIDVSADRVRQVDCYDLKTGERLYRLSRSAEGEAAVLEGVGEKETLDSAKIDRVLGALANLGIDGVRGDREALELDGLSAARRFEYRLFDGTVYTIETAKKLTTDGDENFLTVGVAYDPPPQSGDEKADTQAPAEGDAEKSVADPAVEAQRQNEKLKPWTYSISTWRFENWVSGREDLVKQEQEG